MSPPPECEWSGHDETTSYLIDYVLLQPLITFLQIALLLHFLLHCKELSKNKNAALSLPALFILMQIGAITFHITDAIRGIASKHFKHWYHNKLFCDFTRYMQTYAKHTRLNHICTVSMDDIWFHSVRSCYFLYYCSNWRYLFRIPSTNYRIGHFMLYSLHYTHQWAYWSLCIQYIRNPHA